MCQVNPEHAKNIHYEGNQKSLYLKVIRAMYGCIESALQWYNFLKGKLEGLGFILNHMKNLWRIK